MARIVSIIYGTLAIVCWLMVLYLIFAGPFNPVTNNRALIAFIVIGCLMTFIWIAIIRPQPLYHGKH